MGENNQDRHPNQSNHHDIENSLYNQTPVNMDVNGKEEYPNEEENGAYSKEHGDWFSLGLIRFRTKWSSLLVKYKNEISILKKLVINLCLVAYMICAAIFWKRQGSGVIDWCNGIGVLLILAVFIYWFVFYYTVLKPLIFPKLLRYSVDTTTDSFKTCVLFTRVGIQVILSIAFVVYIIIDTWDNKRRLISLLGFVVLIFGGYLFSKHPNRVPWKIVIWGVIMQLAIGLLTIRFSYGRYVLECIGHHVETFLEFSYEGASFIYGNELVNVYHVFAFKVLSVIFFMSFIIQICFYYGWMQSIFLKLGWMMQICLGTTVAESVNTCASVFLGMTEAPLLIKPYLPDLTRSELTAVMLGGFSTVAGTVFAAYTSLGVHPAHIITSSIMTAPAALSYSKILYPETEISKTTVDNIRKWKSDDINVIDAACKGAQIGTEMVLGIIANIIAFVSFVAFLNATLGWFGGLVGIDDLTIEFIFGKVFIPLSWIMGVEPDQCEQVARLIGIKTVINEFVAYKELGRVKKLGLLSPRSEAIATYSLCGFANPGSVGCLIATLNTLVPSQRKNTIDLAFRAFIGGCVVCLLTACVAGLLMPEEGFPESL
uniref:Solute carrier family 28 member 3 n=1 Tax=Cacopsylla melanoneura TaxID=428564 RepID=A0A8D8MDB0_9HEMI